MPQNLVSGLRGHLAAISPYNNIFKQPSTPSSGQVYGAVYLFRHGNIEVSYHDYAHFIAPFLVKLRMFQSSGRPFVTGTLSFLSSYKSWITDAHVGMLSDEGFKQSLDLGRAFRARYKQWLEATSHYSRPELCIWTDPAMRCQISAIAFSNGISGAKVGATGKQDNHLRHVDTRVEVLQCEDNSHQCNNLQWHKAFCVDQSIGCDKFEKLMQVTTRSIYRRLHKNWHAATPLLARDIYVMQLLHCYDAVANRPTPFDECFQEDDWAGFEYLRDVKYYFSEGYGMPQPGFYAIPWLKAAMTALSNPSHGPQLPLRIAFTHREEILYLCCLLGITFQKNWEPALDRVDEDRQWRAALLAPYLGHVGIESYSGRNGERRVRVILNGDVKPAFWGIAHEDSDGGYDFDLVSQWTEVQWRAWQTFSSSRISFIR